MFRVQIVLAAEFSSWLYDASCRISSAFSSEVSLFLVDCTETKAQLFKTNDVVG